MDIQAIPPEGPEDEWKQQVPRPDRMARTVAAFSNGTGGRIWIGITDQGEVLGVDSEAACERIRLAVALVDPSPRVSFQRLELSQSLCLLRVEVAAGKEGPYCVVGPNGTRTAYLRNRDSTRPTSEKELARLRFDSGRISLNEKDWHLLGLIGQRDGLSLKELAHRACSGERPVRRRLVAFQQAGLTTEIQGVGHALTPRGFKRWRERLSHR